MPNIDAMLINDHMRIKRMFRGFTRWTGDHDLAMAIGYELTAHATIEEEILYPFLRQVDARLADHAEEEHAEVKALITRLQEMDPESKSLRPTVLRLKFDVEAHVEEEEHKVFPLLAPYKQELFDMGRQMVTRQQELLQNRDAPKALTKLATSNTGWGRNSSGRLDVANAGW
ncbi:MAG: hemerythrin domain-containing protein [Actinobacteria bacterium]|nr:hemerythrin domain-containing protein [Actinomycetota bacterium]